MRLTLPFPPNTLSPNKSIHHMALYRAKKAYSEAVGWECKAQGLKPTTAPEVKLHYTFVRPRLDHYDDDNLEARMKCARDMIANILGIDDKNITATREISPDKIKGGCVYVDVTELHPIVEIPFRGIIT